MNFKILITVTFRLKRLENDAEAIAVGPRRSTVGCYFQSCERNLDRKKDATSGYDPENGLQSLVTSQKYCCL